MLAGAIARPESRMGGHRSDAEALAAISTLGRAIKAGYRDLHQMKTDNDLDLRLRARPDFQLLMMDQAFPGRPFTP